MNHLPLSAAVICLNFSVTITLSSENKVKLLFHVFGMYAPKHEAMLGQKSIGSPLPFPIFLALKFLSGRTLVSVSRGLITKLGSICSTLCEFVAIGILLRMNQLQIYQNNRVAWILSSLQVVCGHPFHLDRSCQLMSFMIFVFQTVSSHSWPHICT